MPSASYHRARGERVPTHPRQSHVANENRKRVKRACDECNRLRVRCSGTEPCGKCSESRRKCTFTAPECTVTALKIEELRKRNTKLEKENEKLRKRNTKLEKENEELRERITKLEEENEELRERITGLKALEHARTALNEHKNLRKRKTTEAQLWI